MSDRNNRNINDKSIFDDILDIYIFANAIGLIIFVLFILYAIIF